MSAITEKINQTVKKHNMLGKGDFVVLGVSGGADSMFMLSYFLEIREKLSLRLLVANVEHGIRGEASVKDSEFVESFCKERGVEYRCLRINAPEEAKALSTGVEEYSRSRRYEFFESFNSDKIATAHNLSDNVETVLFRLSRGTGIKGLGAIPAVRGKIIRPLIDCSSDEIRNACAETGIPFVVDETNGDNSYSRNYIRNVVIPDFKKLNPSFEASVSRLIRSAADDNAYIEKEAEKCYETALKDNSLMIDELKAFPISISKRCIAYFTEANGVTLDEKHLSGVYELIGKSGKYQLKGNFFAVSDSKTLRIAEFKDNEISNFSIESKIISVDEFLKNGEKLKKEFDFCCDYDKIIGECYVRTRKEGDFISPSGRNCSKSLKKLFNEIKVPVEKRESLPVLCDENGVFAVKGCCFDERVKIDNITQNVILINIAEETI